jgi:transposase-like protein
MMCPILYYTMKRQSKDPRYIRFEMVRFAKKHGIKPAARCFATTPKTVRKWLRRWQPGTLKGLEEWSKAPKNPCKPYLQNNEVEQSHSKNCAHRGGGQRMKRYSSGIGKAQKALTDFCARWNSTYPKAVACLVADEEQLLTFFQIKDPALWSQIRTTNAIERRFREVRRRTRPMGTFTDRTSMERTLYAVFTYENLRQGVVTSFIMTQNS